MKVHIGDTVSTEFGTGPIVAMSSEWCVVLTSPEAKPGYREVAVPWEEVSIPAEPGEVASAVGEMEVER